MVIRAPNADHFSHSRQQATYGPKVLHYSLQSPQEDRITSIDNNGFRIGAATAKEAGISNMQYLYIYRC